MPEDLKECPFCRSDNVRPHFVDDPHVLVRDTNYSRGLIGLAFWECLGCGARGPVSKATIDDGQGSSNHFRRSRDLWNERRVPYPVLTEKDRLAGFLKQRVVSRPPRYDGEQFYIPLEMPLDAPPADLSSISDTVTVLRAAWTRKRFQKNGQVYQGWCAVIAEQDERHLWTVSANIFQTWPQMFGEKVR